MASTRDLTRDLIARMGRASRLGERTIGHLDAGALPPVTLHRAADCFSENNLFAGISSSFSCGL